jgi:hypothetical protein
MNTMKSVACAIALVTLAGSIVVGARADSILKKLLPAVGGAYAVSAIAKPLNQFIDGALAKNGIGNREATKVVPILSVGDGTYIGAAQVVGSQNAVNSTKAILALRTHFGFAGNWEIEGLVPVNSLSVTNGAQRVYGVGLDAVINLHL